MNNIPCKTCILFAICNSKNHFVIKRETERIIANDCQILNGYIYKEKNIFEIDKKVGEYSDLFNSMTINLDITTYIKDKISK